LFDGVEMKFDYFIFVGSVSSGEKSGRFVVVKSSEISDANENGNVSNNFDI
jgi:hypothetical protein